MCVASEEFQRLLAEIRGGSQEAVRELVEYYAPHIVRAVRRKLSRAIRAKFDSIDFVQAVWASFFAVPQRLGDFEGPDDLVKHLAALAHNKVVDELRRRMETDKYNINREQSLNDSGLHLRGGMAADQPTPSQVALADELWARLLRGRPKHYRRILELRRDGNTQEQIARKLGMNERTVRRVIQRVFEEQTP